MKKKLILVCLVSLIVIVALIYIVMLVDVRSIKQEI